MAGAPIPDPSQQPITAADPRVQQILAMIQAKAAQTPVATTPDPSQSVVSSAPPPPVPTQLGGPTLQAQLPQNPGPPPPVAAPMASQPPSLPAPAQPNVAPTQPGPIKSFLQQLVSGLGGAAYAGTQGALQKLGIPTDYEKEQNALKIGLQQQQQNSLEGLRKTEAEYQSGRLEQLQAQLAPTAIPNDPKYGAFAGTTLPQSAATAVMQKMEALQNAKDIATGKNTTAIQGKEIQYGPGSYMRRGIHVMNGRLVSFDKGDPGNTALQQDLGPDPTIAQAYARGLGYAKGRAMYTPFATTDASGAPTVVSNLQAIQSGAPKQSFTEARNLTSDLVGVKQYQNILDSQISPNLAVLNDPTQRVVIAHTLAEGKDASPGAIQALITSGMQEGALSPQGAALAAGILQAREFGSVARKYGGNMNGTEGLMNRIIGNQASPLNAEVLNRDLIQNDRQFTDKALNSITTLMSNTKRTPVRGGAAAPATPSAPAAPAAAPAGGWAAKFGGVPVKP